MPSLLKSVGQPVARPGPLHNSISQPVVQPGPPAQLYQPIHCPTISPLLKSVINPVSNHITPAQVRQLTLVPNHTIPCARLVATVSTQACCAAQIYRSTCRSFPKAYLRPVVSSPVYHPTYHTTCRLCPGLHTLQTLHASCRLCPSCKDPMWVAPCGLRRQRHPTSPTQRQPSARGT